MEPNRNKRRNLISKPMISMSLHRATNPSSAALQSYNVKPPKPSPVNPEMAKQLNKSKPAPPTGFIIVNQNQVFSQHAPKVAFLAVTDRCSDSYGAKLESFYGAEDEAVDAKAAKYISRLHESFRLEL